MTEEHVLKLIQKVRDAYPNSTFSDGTTKIWVSALQETTLELALTNFKEYILTEKFPPTIADIAKKPERNLHEENLENARRVMLEFEESVKRAVPAPESVRALFARKDEK